MASTTTEVASWYWPGPAFSTTLAVKVLAPGSRVTTETSSVPVLKALMCTAPEGSAATSVFQSQPAPGEVFQYIQPAFQNIAMAQVAKSALNAIEMCFCKTTDTVLFNAHELLYVAIRQARSLAEAGYYPPGPAREVIVAGRTGIANAYMPVKTYIGYTMFGVAQIILAFHFLLMRLRIGQPAGELEGTESAIDFQRRHRVGQQGAYLVGEL